MPAFPSLDSRVQPRWMLPGELAELDGSGHRRHTVRDWTVDTLLFLLAAVIWLGQLDSYEDDLGGKVPDWMLGLDPWVGAVACLALWWRRRFPLALGIAAVPVLAVSGTGIGAVLVMVLTVAVHRRWQAAASITAALFTLMAIWVLAYPDPELGRFFSVVFVGAVVFIPLSWGMAVRARRQLMVSLRREVEHERREHEQRVAAARTAERQRIAREMHDVLAHRLSLLSVHAGALAYRSQRARSDGSAPLEPEETGQAVEIIRDSARQALCELGQVLTVLRADDAGDVTQHGVADVPDLIAEAEKAGQSITAKLADAEELAGRLGGQAQRTVYRAVQEGLTNARKHAPGAPVSIRVAADGDELLVRVTNPMSNGTAATAIPGSGMGLTGLAERIALHDGRLEHRVCDGEFCLEARIPVGHRPER